MGQTKRAWSLEWGAWSKEQGAGSIERGGMNKREKTKRNKKLFRFQDLEIWKKAIEIGDKLFDIAIRKR